MLFRSGGGGALITIQRGKKVPLSFDKLIDSKTDKTKIRFVDINTESYEVAQKYMIKLSKEDLTNRKKLRKLAKLTNMKPNEFKAYFSVI